MERPLDFIRGLTIIVVGIIFVFLTLRYWLRRSQDDPKRLIKKWILSALVLALVFLILAPAIASGSMGYASAFLITFVAGCGVVLAIIWTPNIAGWVGQKFESLYTGGEAQAEPTPLYSVAEARRKQGRYQEAIKEIRSQLDQFPQDPTGHFMLAEIQARNLHDVSAAKEILNHFCSQPNHSPENVWQALNTLADWQLELDEDLESARQSLEYIIEILPDTVQAQRASQRLGMLADSSAVRAAHDHSAIPMQEGVDDIGLRKDTAELRPEEPDPETVAAQLGLHLDEHPLDAMAREQLATLYSDHYHDLSLASEQLEILIGMPSQPKKSQVRWLHLLADFQTRHGESYEVIRQTIQRVIDLEAGGAATALAQQRLNHLRLALKGKEKSRPIQFGRPEENSDTLSD